jgi:Reverse transcriptase (RNA-dependent DNA polymerase)
MLAYALQRKEVDGLSQEEIVKVLQPELFDWRDPGHYTHAYHALVDVPGSPVEYSREVNMTNTEKPFPLRPWVELHVAVCRPCQDFMRKCGSVEVFMHRNASNPCPLADTLSWLSGEWRIPFESIPPAGAKDNYKSLFYDIHAAKKEIDRMKEWGTIVPGEAHLVHPAMGVIRDSDLRDACRILHAIGRPSPAEDKKSIALINEHIKAILEEGVPIPPHLGVLKEIAVRFCIDASKLLNTKIKDWKFTFAKVHDLVRLLRKGWRIARIDLHKYFNQLPLHRDDWKMFGLRLPKDLERLEEEFEEWISAFCHFGGKPFPAYANAVMAAICFILQGHGIQCVYMTDDIAICAPTLEECKAQLEKAIRIIKQLGLKIQETKILHPAQVMPFLGILIDTVNERLSIPPEKLDNIHRAILRILEDYQNGSLLASDLESLIGKLGWIVEVMIAGKAHLRSLRLALPRWWFHHRHVGTLIQLDDQAIQELYWWLDFIKESKDHPFWVPFWTHTTPLHCRVFSDASGDVGFGLSVGNQVFQGLWQPEALPQSSGYKELIPVLLAVQHLGPEASGKIVVITTDNLGNVLAINKGVCRSPESHTILAAIMELAAHKRIYLVADWCPRENNEFMDRVSKEPWGDDVTSAI